MPYLNLTPDDFKFQQKKDTHISIMSVCRHIEKGELPMVTIPEEEGKEPVTLVSLPSATVALQGQNE
jgi:hypothetical protein